MPGIQLQSKQESNPKIHKVLREKQAHCSREVSHLTQRPERFLKDGGWKRTQRKRVKDDCAHLTAAQYQKIAQE